MKPTAWYDPSNGVVSTDRDCPLFTPLGQVWALSIKREWVGLTDEDIVDALQPLYQTRALADLAAELFMDEFQVVICKFMEKNT
jgi:hypothetical protein